MLRAAFDLVAIPPGRDAQTDAARAGEVILPERQALRALRLAVGVEQMNATRRRLARRVIDVDLQLDRLLLPADRRREEKNQGKRQATRTVGCGHFLPPLNCSSFGL